MNIGMNPKRVLLDVKPYHGRIDSACTWLPCSSSSHLSLVEKQDVRDFANWYYLLITSESD